VTGVWKALCFWRVAAWRSGRAAATWRGGGRMTGSCGTNSDGERGSVEWTGGIWTHSSGRAVHPHANHHLTRAWRGCTRAAYNTFARCAWLRTELQPSTFAHAAQHAALPRAALRRPPPAYLPLARPTAAYRTRCTPPAPYRVAHGVWDGRAPRGTAHAHTSLMPVSILPIITAEEERRKV